MPDSAKVNIVVDALTSAAEEAVDDVGDQLNKLAVDAEPAQAAMDEAADELDDAANSARSAGRAFASASGATGTLAAAMSVLSNRADEAGDEVASAGAKSGFASGGFTSLSLSTEGLSLAFGSLSSTITLTLIPALLALLSTLVPLVATIGGLATAAAGLAGAFGAVVGSGILAFGKKLSKQNKKQLQQINDQIKAIKERKKARSNLTKEQQKALKNAKSTVQRLEEKAKSTSTLTDAQKKQLKSLKSLRDQLLEQARTKEGLTKQQQEQLVKTREQIDELRTLRQSTSELTKKEKEQLNAARETIQTLKAKRAESGKLTKQEQKRLEQLKEKRKKLKEQTSVTGALKKRVGELKDELMPLIAGFGKQFIPLIEDALAALPTLLKNIGAATGGFGVFADALRSIGQTAMTAIPAMASALLEFAKTALPVLMDFGRWMLANGADIFAGMVSTTKKVAPMLLDLGKALVDALPAINKLGIAVLKTLIPALADLLGKTKAFLNSAAFQRIADVIKLTDYEARALREGFKQLKAGFMAMLPVMIEAFKIMKGMFVPAIGAAINIIGQLARAFGSLPLKGQKILFGALLIAVSALLGPIGALVAVVTGLALAWDGLVAGIMDGISAGKAFLSWVKGGLLAGFEKFKAGVTNLWKTIKQSAARFFASLPKMAVTALAVLMTVWEKWGTGFFNFFAGLWNSITKAGRNALQGLIDMTISALNKFLKTIDGVADAVSEISGVDLPDLGKLKSVDLSAQGAQIQKREFNRKKAQKQNKQEVRAVLDVKGDNPLANFIRSEVSTKVEKRDRSKTREIKRKQNRGPQA